MTPGNAPLWRAEPGLLSLTAVRVLLIRHGCAGNKRRWSGDDAERPLDPAGYRQAAALATALMARPFDRIASSPTKRCIDTVVPLAHARGLQVEEWPQLGRATSGDELWELVTSPEAADTVLCTHGEVMTGLLERLRADGVPMTAAHTDDAWLLAKGSGWDLTVEGGAVKALRHFHPAPDLDCPEHTSARSSG